MDAMALLCNLQADGPATLRRLHELGCHTLDDLERVPVFELSDALGSDTSFAQRFIREARTLRQRFGTGEPEAEEARVPLPGSERLEAARIARRAATRDASPAPTARPKPHPAALPPAGRTLKSLPAQPAGTPLRAGLVEGLDADWCKALIGQGVLTLDALVDAPGLPLARALERPYPRLLDLQCLAKRHLAQKRAAVTLERAGESEPEVLRAGSDPTTARPLSQPDVTIFPPARDETRLPSPPTDPEPPTSDSTLAQQDAGIGGPFA